MGARCQVPWWESPARAQIQDSSILSDVPLMDARIFRSEATYKLPIKPQTRYFLRLYFYPSDYAGLNVSNSYFSVVAAGVTLLNNFSAPITAQALTFAYLVKEYSLAPIDSDTLSITFKPSDKAVDAFAFVNGIEVVPIPGDLFGSGIMTGFSDITIDAKDSNLETMYRLNVAGQYIAPNKDSGGLARNWYNDAPYLYGAAVGVNRMANKTVQINYADLPEYVAPVDVYQTARGMGPDSAMNLKFNLTWMFLVDANFTYIVRLHFCEFELTRSNQKGFNIYINNQTAQGGMEAADIIAWTGQIGKPTYKDYMISVNDRQGDDHIQVDLNPSTLYKPEYYDATLNGLEIFKMSDQKNNLAGPNPELSAMLTKALAEEKQKTFQSSGVGIEGAAGGAAGFCVVAAICIAVYQRKRRDPNVESHTSSWLPVYTNSYTSTSKSTISGKSTTSSHLSTLAQGLCRHFTLPEMKKATKNFDESNVIGVGGFGKVYKGIIDQNVKVAIKKSNPQSEQGVNEFQTEIEMLSKLRHKHLRQQLTEKSDVYSFGVVLFEVLCARPALNPNLSKEQVSLADWALHCQRKGILEDIIDPHIKGKINPECLKKFAETAEKCLEEAGTERPSMGDVLWSLEFALQLQENSEGSRHSTQVESSDISGEILGNNHETNLDSDETGEIFSQIVNPKGR
ncbi:hypothetical protein GH714_002373 [Hevea brasiliensis]|uniref:Protein kinase domain-containing protein n=1 Tax=Hevea brasiliensis TaxID=3981 RepID=A0A6A6KJU6_HEVBR|nr:hypothetical protein GH714_002373 [Hevea brasiliensis]